MRRKTKRYGNTYLGKKFSVPSIWWMCVLVRAPFGSRCPHPICFVHILLYYHIPSLCIFPKGDVIKPRLSFMLSIFWVLLSAYLGMVFLMALEGSWHETRSSHLLVSVLGIQRATTKDMARWLISVWRAQKSVLIDPFCSPVMLVLYSYHLFSLHTQTLGETVVLKSLESCRTAFSLPAV